MERCCSPLSTAESAELEACLSGLFVAGYG